MASTNNWMRAGLDRKPGESTKTTHKRAADFERRQTRGSLKQAAKSASSDAIKKAAADAAKPKSGKPSRGMRALLGDDAPKSTERQTRGSSKARASSDAIKKAASNAAKGGTDGGRARRNAKRMMDGESKPKAKAKPSVKPLFGRIAGRAAGAAGLMLHSKSAGKGSDKPVATPGSPRVTKKVKSAAKKTDMHPAISATKKPVKNQNVSKPKQSLPDTSGPKMHPAIRATKKPVRSQRPYEDDIVFSKKTKGGNYPVYKKGSRGSRAFQQAFKEAAAEGKKEFSWQGRKYKGK